jgi:hypothetical protein
MSTSRSMMGMLRSVARSLLRFCPICLVLALAPEACAQSCAMCLTSAMAQGGRAMEAMNLGILVLLVPPFLIIVGVLGFTFTRRS